MTDATDIKIDAMPSPTWDSCEFTIDRELYPDVNASFSSAEQAEGSPIAELLFGVEGISEIIITPKKIWASTGKPGSPWSQMAREIGKLIREQHATGEPPVAEDRKNSLSEDAVLKMRVQELFDNEINPQIAMHGGIIQLLDVKDKKVYIKMGGGCQGCGMASVTLKQGVEQTIREKVPEIVEILDQTDHASGENPYYQQVP
jgi:Fe-S cluster biogenesis protein NfuA